MTTWCEGLTNRDYRTCLDGGGVHAWRSTGLDCVPDSVFPRTVVAKEDGEILCSTRRCVWCQVEQAKVYPSGSRWKAVT